METILGLLFVAGLLWWANAPKRRLKRTLKKLEKDPEYLRAKYGDVYHTED